MPPSVEASPEAHPRALLVQRAFSLTGVVPLGAFLVVHAAINARALYGDRAFAGAVGAVQGVPGLPLIEALLVYLPLAVHGGIGLWLTLRRLPRVPPAPYPPSVRLWMRVTGVAAAAFLAMHLPELRFYAPGAHLGAGALATRLDADLSATSHGVPWRGIAYLAGTACVTFHFAAGLWGAFAATDRARASIQRRRWAAWTLAAVGAAVWLTFANVVVFRATGSELFGEPIDEPSEPCP